MTSTSFNRFSSAHSACIFHSSTFSGSADSVRVSNISWHSRRPFRAWSYFLHRVNTVFEVNCGTWDWYNKWLTHLNEFFQVRIIHVCIEKFGTIGQCCAPSARRHFINTRPQGFHNFTINPPCSLQKCRRISRHAGVLVTMNMEQPNPPVYLNVFWHRQIGVLVHSAPKLLTILAIDIVKWDNAGDAFHMPMFDGLTKRVVHIHLSMPEVNTFVFQSTLPCAPLTVHPSENPRLQQDRKSHASMLLHRSQWHHSPSLSGERHSGHGAHYMSISATDQINAHVKKATDVEI